MNTACRNQTYRMRLVAVVLLSVLVAALLPRQADAQLYDMIRLGGQGGTFGATDSLGLDINNNGEVSGRASSLSD